MVLNGDLLVLVDPSLGEEQGNTFAQPDSSKIDRPCKKLAPKTRAPSTPNVARDRV